MPTYLVTGAAGFIGARFVESCTRGAKGIDVISVDRESYFQDRAEHQGIDFGRIVDRDQLFDWLAREKPALTGIVHLGACANTMETDEAFLTRNNVEYSKSLWTYATTHKIPMIYASSAATYGAGELGYDDDEKLVPRLKPLNLYGESKQRFDLWALQEELQGKTPPGWAGFKFFNVYGFGERHKGPMASVILHASEQLHANGAVKLFKSHKAGVADGHQARDFIFVEDVVDVLHYALEKPIPRGIFNLGSGQARTFLDLVKAVFRATRKPENIQFIDTPLSIRDKYQYFTEAKVARLRAEGYAKPFTSLEEGVAKYIARLAP